MNNTNEAVQLLNKALVDLKNNCRDDFVVKMVSDWIDAALRALAATATVAKDGGEPVAWIRKTDITELTDSEPETNGWMPLFATPKPEASANTLRAVLEIVRNSPDYDEGGPMAGMIDEALSGKVPALLGTIDSLAQGRKPESAEQPAGEPIGYVSKGLIENALSKGFGASSYIQAGQATEEFPVAIYLAAPISEDTGKPAHLAHENNGEGCVSLAAPSPTGESLSDDEQRVWLIEDEAGEPVMMCPKKPGADYLADVSAAAKQACTVAEYFLRPAPTVPGEPT